MTVSRTLRMGAAATGVVLLAGACSIGSQSTNPMPFAPGEWVSDDGRYRVSLDEASESMVAVLPRGAFSEHSQPCETDDGFAGPETTYGTWAHFETSDSLALMVGNVVHLIGPAHDGDWTVIEDSPCGPDETSLYLTWVPEPSAS